MLETERITLRPIMPEDSTQVFAYRSDKQANMYQSWVADHQTEVDAFISKNPAEFDIHDTWFQLVIVAKEDSAVIGDIGVHFIDSDGAQCEIGCTLSSTHYDKGYATEALRSVITYLFGKLGKHRITASVDPRNEASIRLMERLGFRQEAHFRQSYFFRGTWADDIIYAMLKSEWKM